MTIEDLKMCRRWMPWKIHNNGKAPCNRAGFLCADNVEAHWMTYEEAQGVVAAGKANGARLCFSPDSNGEVFGVVAWDLDGAVSANGDVAPWAAEIVQAINSYTEVSPSGDGLHIFALADDLPIGKRTEPVMGGGKVEFFHGSGGLTFTGNAQEGFTEIKVSTEECLQLHREWFPEKTNGWQPTGGTSTLTDEEVLSKARRAKNGEEFEEYYEGGVCGDASEADFYLLSLLYFWSNGDPGQMDRLFRESALFRDKWDEKHARDGRTYGQLSLDNLLCLAEDGGWATYSGHAGNGEVGTEGDDDGADSDEWSDPTPFLRPKLRAFPVDALPSWGRSFVEAVAESYQLPACFPAMIFLGALASANAAKYRVNVAADWNEELALWIVAAMETGSGRSPAMDEMLRPLRDHERRLIREAVPEQQRIISDNVALAARIKRLESEAKKAESVVAALAIGREISEARERMREEMHTPQILMEDATPEVVGRRMAENHGRIAIASDEGGPIAMLLGRYSGDGEAAVENILKAYSGGDFKVDRVKDNYSSRVLRAQLTFILSPQPARLAAMMGNEKMRACGLLARFLYALPASTVGQRDHSKEPHEVPAIVREEYHQRMTALLDIPLRLDADGVPERRMLHFSPEARDLMRRFRCQLEPRLKTDGHDLLDWLSKIHGQIARIAANLHLADGHGEADAVSADTVGRALRIGAGYLEDHAWAAYYGEATDAQTVHTAERILGWVTRSVVCEFTLRQAHRALKNARLKTAEDLRPGARLLQRHGYVRPMTAAAGPKGGRPTTKYVVNPTVAG